MGAAEQIYKILFYHQCILDSITIAEIAGAGQQKAKADSTYQWCREPSQRFSTDMFLFRCKANFRATEQDLEKVETKVKQATYDIYEFLPLG